VENVDAFLPTSAWRENRASLVRKVDEGLWEKLALAYAVLEIDRARFIAANGLPAFTPLPAKEAEGIKESYSNLGRLRRKLGDGGGGWLDEIDNDFKPRIDSLNDDFRHSG
jgi:hypothetical protein